MNRGASFPAKGSANEAPPFISAVVYELSVFSMIYEMEQVLAGVPLGELTQAEHPKLRQVTHPLAASIPLTGKQLPCRRAGHFFVVVKGISIPDLRWTSN